MRLVRAASGPYGLEGAWGPPSESPRHPRQAPLPSPAQSCEGRHGARGVPHSPGGAGMSGAPHRHTSAPRNTRDQERGPPRCAPHAGSQRSRHSAPGRGFRSPGGQSGPCPVPGWAWVMAPGGSPTTSFASFLLGVLRTISRSRTRTRRCALDATHASRWASVSSEWPPLPWTRQKADVEPLGLTQPQPPERAAPAGQAPAPKPQAQRPLPRAGWARRRRGTPRPQPVPCSPPLPWTPLPGTRPYCPPHPVFESGPQQRATSEPEAPAPARGASPLGGPVFLPALSRARPL